MWPQVCSIGWKHILLRVRWNEGRMVKEKIKGKGKKGASYMKGVKRQMEGLSSFGPIDNRTPGTVTLEVLRSCSSFS